MAITPPGGVGAEDRAQLLVAATDLLEEVMTSDEESAVWGNVVSRELPDGSTLLRIDLLGPPRWLWQCVRVEDDMTDENDVSRSGVPQALDDAALEFVTGGAGTIKLCSNPASCSTGVGSNTTTNQTIYFSTNITTTITT